MRSIKPPPKVNLQDPHQTRAIPSNPAAYNASKEPPRFSNWQREGYPSEYAYAKALGSLEIQKPGRDERRNGYDKQSMNGRPTQDGSYHTEKPVDDFEAAVQREMQLLEQRFRNPDPNSSSQDMNMMRDREDHRRPEPTYPSKPSYAQPREAQLRQDYHQHSSQQPVIPSSGNSKQSTSFQSHVSPVRRIGGGIKSLYGGEDDNKAAVKAAYAKLLAQQVEEQRAQKESSKQSQRQSNHISSKESLLSSPSRNNHHQQQYQQQQYQQQQYQQQSAIAHHQPDPYHHPYESHHTNPYPGDNHRQPREYTSPEPPAAPVVDKWRPSGNYSDDREKQKKAAMKALLDQQRENDIRYKKEQQEREKQEEMRLEQCVRDTYEREEQVRRNEAEMKKQAIGKQMQRDRDLQDEMTQQALARKGKKIPVASNMHDHGDIHDYDHHETGSDYHDNYHHYDNNTRMEPPSSPSRQHEYHMDNPINNNSPSKPARARLISDVYGSAGILSHDTLPPHMNQESKWRPSGKQGDDKSKAARLEMKAMLDHQRQEDQRLKDEEKKRIADKEKQLEMKIKQAEAEEEMAKKKAVEQRRYQAIEQERKDVMKQEEKRLEILAKKGHRLVSEDESANQHHQQQQRQRQPSPPPMRSNPKSPPSSPPSSRADRYQQQQLQQQYQHQPDHIQPQNPYDSYNSNNRFQQPSDPRSMMPPNYPPSYPPQPNMMPMQQSYDYHPQPPYYPPNRYSQERLSSELRAASDLRSSFQAYQPPVHQSYDHHHSNRNRPDSAEEVDAFLSKWQQQHSLSSSLSSTSSSHHQQQHHDHHRVSQDQNDMSFVGDSRFINASITSVSRILDEGAPPPARAHIRPSHQQPSYRHDEIDPEKSLDSESLFYYVGDRPSILENTIIAPSQPIKRNLIAEAGNRTSIQASANKQAPPPLSQLLDHTNQYIQQERKKDHHSIDNLSRALSSQSSLTPRSSAALSSSGREVINPQKSPSESSTRPSSAGGSDTAEQYRRRSQVNMNHQAANHVIGRPHSSAHLHDEWIGEDEIIVMPSSQSPVVPHIPKAKGLEKDHHVSSSHHFDPPKALVRADSDGLLLGRNSKLEDSIRRGSSYIPRPSSAKPYPPLSNPIQHQHHHSAIITSNAIHSSAAMPSSRPSTGVSGQTRSSYSRGSQPTPNSAGSGTSYTSSRTGSDVIQSTSRPSSSGHSNSRSSASHDNDDDDESGSESISSASGSRTGSRSGSQSYSDEFDDASDDLIPTYEEAAKQLDEILKNATISSSSLSLPTSLHKHP